jgi:hypothetical protein
MEYASRYVSEVSSPFYVFVSSLERSNAVPSDRVLSPEFSKLLYLPSFVVRRLSYA